MWRARAFLLRLYHSLRPQAAEADLRREIDSHLGVLEDRYHAAGISRNDARRAARRTFGGVEQAKERHRDARSFRWLADALQDSRHVSRGLRTTPVASTLAIGSLALGLGALVGVYSTFDWLVNRPPGGVVDPAQVIVLNTADRQAPDRTGYYFSYAQFDALRRAQRPFTSIAAFGKLAGVLSTPARADQIVIELASAEFFPMLGVRPMRGRLLGPEDAAAGNPIPVVLSERFWQTAFAGTPQVVGQTIRVNGQLGEVVGVAPRTFESLGLDWNGPTDVWVPLTSATALGSRLLVSTQPFFPVLGRLRPGVTTTAALAQLQGVLPQLPPHLQLDTYQPTDIVSVPLDHMRLARRENSRRFFTPLLAVCGLVLLAACVNLSEFMAGRLHARRTELAVRSALGASRTRLFRQLLAEAAGVATLAIVGGIVVSACAIEILSATSRLYIGLPAMARFLETTAALDWHVFVMVAALGSACTLLFGVVPGAATVLRAPSRDLRFHARGGAAARWAVRARHLLASAQVALAVALSLVATLYALSFLNVSRVRSGYGDPGHVLLARVNANAVRAAERPTFYRTLLTSLAQDPAVAGATIGWNPPYVVGHSRMWRPGQETAGRIVALTAAGERFFEVQRIDLLAGREFNGSNSDITSAVIINAPLARLFWPGQARFPLGESLTFRTGSAETPRVVVGVVADNGCDNILDENRPCAWIAVPLTDGLSMLRIRTHADPASAIPVLRRAVHALHPDAAVSEEVALDRYIASTTAQHRAAMLASSGLAALTVVLVAAGLAAMFTAMVRQRERELALRLALGASPARLRRSVLMAGLVTAGLGAVVGTALGWWASRLVAPQLYHVSIDDVRLLLVPTVLIVIALAAVWRAAHVAATVDPSLPLKSAAVG
jgi:predicted permease